MSLDNNASEKLFESKVKQLALLNGWHCFHATPHQVRPGVFLAKSLVFLGVVFVCHCVSFVGSECN